MQREKIENWFKDKRNEMIADLKKLVEINSVSVKSEGKHVCGENCAVVLDTMLEMGEGYGFRCENADYYGGRISYQNGEKTIGMWGHLDIVPHGDDWIYPKYEMTVTDEFLIGRGVADNKNACIQNLYAMRCIKDLGIDIKSTLSLFVGCAEEVGMHDVEKIVDKFGESDVAIVTDSSFPVCNGEKGIFSALLSCDRFSDDIVDFNAGLVENALPGSAYIVLNRSIDEFANLSNSITVEATTNGVKLSAVGSACHAASPEDGVNAIAVLLKPLLDNNIFHACDAPYFNFIFHLCSTHDGSALDIIYEDDVSGPLTLAACVVRKNDGAVSLSLNIRYPVTTKDDDMISSIEKAARRNGFDLVKSDNNKPYFQPENTWYVKTLMKIYCEITDRPVRCYTMGGGTYARKLKNAVGFGPGIKSDFAAINLPAHHGSPHMPDEAIKIENFIKAAVIYTLSLIELDKLITS